jgi:acetyl-CoA carboxylase biotin carboxylase subunit
VVIPVFRKVLIANRGEIAIRIARTCRDLGIPTVAVYSTADRDTPVVDIADEAVHIGAPPARRSYLSIPAIIEAARNTGADAIHPGYGFLSENGDFAEICAANDIRFIGPGPAAMELLADKAATRELMARAGLPVLPGSRAALADEAEARALAHEAGYPVILKAVAGGGGRGMVVVHRPADLVRAFRDTQAVARSIFGDSQVYLERYLESARHIEVQVLCDEYGSGVHLGERDCSAQRRHQKIVEESPASGLSEETRAELYDAAVHGALAAGFVGAGTMEFLVTDDGSAYFMEMNARLQVEHPVTEAVTGIDLVEQQIRIAAGWRVVAQQSIAAQGASIECRVNAEDPDRGFLPAAGRLRVLRLPGGPFVRVDTHCERDAVITTDYDPLLAKIITWGRDRATAIARMERALGETRVDGDGLRTNREFLLRLLATEAFRKGRYNTNLVAGVTGDRVDTRGWDQ